VVLRAGKFERAVASDGAVVHALAASLARDAPRVQSRSCGPDPLAFSARTIARFSIKGERSADCTFAVVSY
jgi:hypothetical protein